MPAATASCPQIAGCGVQICDFEPSESVLEHPEDVGLPTLNIQGLLPVNRPSSMQRLLAALRPGGMPAVERLELYSCALDEPALAHCSALAAVTHLGLQHCEAAAGSDWEAVMAALRQATLLASLYVWGSLDGELPECLAAHTSLHTLTLFQNDLMTLPPGPYLGSLQRLSLWVEGWSVLPPALTAATALTCLELRQEEQRTGPPLTADSVAVVIPKLQALQRLQLAFCGLKALPIEGWAGLSALQWLDLSANDLTSLPAALSQATSLRRLNLGWNNHLAPSAQQLGALLSRLPLLEELSLDEVGLEELPENLPTGKRCTACLHNVSAGPVADGSAGIVRCATSRSD